MGAARLAMLADGQPLAAVCTPPALSHIVRPDAELASTLQPAYRLSQSLYAHLYSINSPIVPSVWPYNQRGNILSSLVVTAPSSVLFLEDEGD